MVTSSLRKFIRFQLLESSKEDLANDFAARAEELWDLYYEDKMKKDSFQEKLEELYKEAEAAGVYNEMGAALNKRSQWYQEELNSF